MGRLVTTEDILDVFECQLERSNRNDKLCGKERKQRRESSPWVAGGRTQNTSDRAGLQQEGRESRQVQILEDEAVLIVRVPPSHLVIFCLSLSILPHKSLDGRDHDSSTGSLSTRFGR